MNYKNYLLICAVFGLFNTFVKANESPSTDTKNITTVWKNKSPINTTANIIENIEEDEKDKETTTTKNALKSSKISRQNFNFWPTMEKDADLLLLEQVLEDIERGRGKSHRYKKFTKFMYPLFMGVLIAKIILIPLILKMLTAISSTALVLGKISLITTGFLALKWIFSGNIYDTKDRFEVIYLPNGKPYRSASGGISLYDDQTWSDSNNHYLATAATVGQQKYIPVTLKHEFPYNSYRNAGGGSGGNSIKDFYYYTQQQNNNNDGKPFL